MLPVSQIKGKDAKPHIGIFGRRNYGKSSLINLLTGQNIAIVSDKPGTTTDPIKKSVEIFGIGPAIIVDTGGIDDKGELGKLRVEKSLKVIETIDLAIVLISNNTFEVIETELIEKLKYYDIPYVLVHNKSDIYKPDGNFYNKVERLTGKRPFTFSNINQDNFDLLVEKIKKTMPKSAYTKSSLFGSIVKPKDIVLLVTPIDSEAPTSRMILPQVMAWRDLLDNNCICMSVKETELEDFFRTGIKPALVVTDSQVFKYVSEIVPEDIMLTSFSIVFSNYKGDIDIFINGTPYIDKLKDDDRVLILESCTHHVSCDDIGRYKLPQWIKEYTNKTPEFEIVPGLSEIKNPVDSYNLVIQCGGCMVTKKQISSRLKPFIDEGVPVTNYGMVISYVNGIFDRVIKPFLTQKTK